MPARVAVGRTCGMFGGTVARHLLAAGLIALIGALAPTGSEAQQPKKIPRLCFLTFDPGTLAFNAGGVSSATSLPWSTMAMRSHNRSASSM